jgi:phosphoribosyl 1,2-cyclic phosphodiesterase/ActR/RegA family two-component response regulator
VAGDLIRKVVVVDDDVDILRIVAKRLRASGYEVITASDGASGLQAIRAERPRLALLDLMMPGLHGFAVCQEIRADPTLSSTHVIVTTAKAFPVDKQQAREAGANDYITKPYSLDDLVTMVDAVFSSSRTPIRVKFWGTRGSIPTPGPSTARYGGNTACVELRFGDTIVMLDCGTGAREMGLALMDEFAGRRMDLHGFIGHTHWDHIQGFPFFAPAYEPNARIKLYSLRGAEKSLQKVFTGQMDAAYFPVTLGDLSAHLEFIEIGEELEVGGAKVTHAYLNHPGVAIGFRFEYHGRSVVYVSDHENYCRMSGNNEHNRRLDRELSEFARGADLYIREAQYTEEEYRTKRTWGHSVWSDALDCAHAAKVRKVALYHHDPMHDDEQLDTIARQARDYMLHRDMGFDLLMAADYLELYV